MNPCSCRPFTRDDLAFVESVAGRVVIASTRARRWVHAHELRRALFDGLAPVIASVETADALDRTELDQTLETALDDPQAVVAVLDVELNHLTCTKGYAVLLAEDPSIVQGTSLMTHVDDVSLLDAVLNGELDFRSEDLDLTRDRGDLTFHMAMLRRRDATPWAVLVVAHPVARPLGS